MESGSNSPAIVDRLQELLAGRYRLERELGAGGMGTVYLARDLKHDRRVALKVLRPELSETLGVRRFLEETRVTATLQHPNILPLFDSGEAGGLLYYVMPFVDGESLRERLSRDGALPIADAARILRDIVDGLAAAHHQGIIHRDMKPENVLLSGRHALITDFGIAKAVSTTSVAPQRTTAGVALGTPMYMAPEQVTADPHVDHRADIYAVGAVAYELLTGKPPFAGRSTPQLFLAHLNEVPRPVRDLRRDVPRGLEDLVMRCLEKRPADRWQRAEELLPFLDAAAAGLPGRAPPRVPAMARTRYVGGLALMAGALAGAVAIVGLLLNTGTRTGPARGAESPTSRLVVMPLVHLSGGTDDAQWGRRAAAAVTRAIDSAGAVELVPEVTMLEAVGRGPPTATLVADRTHATHAVAGTVLEAAGRLEMRVEIVDVRHGPPRLVHSIGPVSGPRDSADVLVARLATRTAASIALLFRGVSLPLPVERTPAVAAVIGLMERASELGCDLRFEEAEREVRKALELDPGYIPALATLAYLSTRTGKWRATDSLAAILDTLGDRMLPRERLYWDTQRALADGDWSAATATVEKAYRSDPAAWGHLAGFVALSTHRVSEALARLQAARPAANCYLPQSGVFRLRSQAFHLLGRYDEELADAKRFREIYPANALALEAELRALAGGGHAAALDSLLAQLPATPSLSVWGPVRAALELRAHGQPEVARRVMERVLGAQEARLDSAATEDRALALFFAGRWPQAASHFAGLANDSPDSASHLRYRGVSLAMMGRRSEAVALQERIGRMSSRTPGQVLYYQAVIAAALGDAREATFLLDRAFRSGYGFDIRYHRDPWWSPIEADAAFRSLIRPR